VLAVPFVNLMVPWLDRRGARLDAWIRRASGSFAGLLASHRFHVAAWSVAFVALSHGIRYTDYHQLLYNPPWAVRSQALGLQTIEVEAMCRRNPGVCKPWAFHNELLHFLSR
jgi:hypothetical protein